MSSFGTPRKRCSARGLQCGSLDGWRIDGLRVVLHFLRGAAELDFSANLPTPDLQSGARVAVFAAAIQTAHRRVDGRAKHHFDSAECVERRREEGLRNSIPWRS